MNVLHAEVKKSEKHDDRLLLIPRNVEGNRQIVDIVQPEDFLQFQGNQSQRIRVIALPGIKYARDTTDIAQSKLVVLVLGTACGQNFRSRQPLPEDLSGRQVSHAAPL